MSTTISAAALNIGYTQRRGVVNVVHSNLSLSLKSGEVTALLGLNGAGKSTLLRTLCGFQPPLGGEVMLMERPLSSYSQRDVSRTIGVVLTEKTNAGGITVYDLVGLGRHPYTGFFGELSAEDHSIVEESLAAVGISHKSRNFVSELSDGERQKVMIAKALAQQCPIIVLDEPTAFLDVISRVETMVLLRRLAHEQGKAILLSTHDLDMAIQMCDSLWLLEKGAPLRMGSPEDLILNGDLTSFFSRADIAFDPTTGRLMTPAPVRKIGVAEGESVDRLTTIWMKSALVRADFLAVDPLADGVATSVQCKSPSEIVITKSNGESVVANSIAETLRLLA